MTTPATTTHQDLIHQPIFATSDGLRRLGDDGSVFEGSTITAVHAGRRQTWVLVDGRDLHRLDGEGTVSVARLDDAATGRCVIAHGDEVFVGGDQAGLWRLVGNRLEPVTAFDRAPTRSDWHTPWGGPPAVFSMASYGDDLYVSVHVGGILRTSDRGRTWTPTIDLHDDVHRVVVDESGGMWAATGMRGLAHSRDRGASWRYLTDGLHARYLLAVAVTSDSVLVGASSGHAARDGGLYRLVGDRLERSQDGLPEHFGGAVSPRQLAAAGDEALVVLPGGDAFASRDGGRSWSWVADSLPGVSEVVLQPPD